MKKNSLRTRAFLAAGAMSACLVFSVAGVLAQSAQDGDASKVIDITSDTMELRKENNQAVFIGKVDALRDGVRLRSDRLVADYIEIVQPDGSKKTEVQFLNASGNVVVVTDKQHITSNKFRMDVKKDKVVMWENVVVKEGSSVIRGPKLFMDLTTNESKMQGGRVKGRFFPQE
ncbi:MAG: LptA/OstA family protein [Hyphomicrobiales bacterium]